jgi:hypothetical protein
VAIKARYVNAPSCTADILSEANVHHDTVSTARSFQVILDEPQPSTRYFV